MRQKKIINYVLSYIIYEEFKSVIKINLKFLKQKILLV